MELSFSGYKSKGSDRILSISFHSRLPRHHSLWQKLAHAQRTSGVKGTRSHITMMYGQRNQGLDTRALTTGEVAGPVVKITIKTLL